MVRKVAEGGDEPRGEAFRDLDFFGYGEIEVPLRQAAQRSISSAIGAIEAEDEWAELVVHGGWVGKDIHCPARSYTVGAGHVEVPRGAAGEGRQQDRIRGEIAGGAVSLSPVLVATTPVGAHQNRETAPGIEEGSESPASGETAKESVLTLVEW